MANFHLDLNDATLAAQDERPQPKAENTQIDQTMTGTYVPNPMELSLNTNAPSSNMSQQPPPVNFDLDFNEEPEFALHPSSNKNFANAVGVILGLAIIAGASFYLFPSVKKLILPSEPVVSNVIVKQAREIIKTPVVENVNKENEMVAENPYWYMSVKLGQADQVQGRIWLKQEEESLRRSINSDYYYQKYAVLKEIRRRKLQGSQGILWELVEAKKFWLRMEALIALGDMGVSYDMETFVGTINGVAQENINRFVDKVLSRKLARGEVYLLKRLVSVVGAENRLKVIKALAGKKLFEHEKLLAAASMDPDYNVRETVASYLSKYNIAPERFETLRRDLRILTAKAFNQGQLDTQEEQAKEVSLKSESIDNIDLIDQVEFVSTKEGELNTDEDSESKKSESISWDLDGINDVKVITVD